MGMNCTARLYILFDICWNTTSKLAFHPNLEESQLKVTWFDPAVAFRPGKASPAEEEIHTNTL